MIIIQTQDYSAFNIKSHDTSNISVHLFLRLRCDW